MFYELVFFNVQKLINEWKAVDGVHMDFCKAFHNVPHGRLSHKIKLHGMHNGCLDSELA